MSDIDAKLARIRLALTRLRKKDKRCSAFGSEQHRYQLGPTLSVERVDAFESETGVSLPDGFRRFVTEVGNGGAGPAYGWQPFDPSDPDYRAGAWRRPFVHPAMRDAAVDDDLDIGGIDDGEEEEGEGEEPDGSGGIIHLHDYGCGIFDFLVVHGAERGNLWLSDDRCRHFPLPAPGAFPSTLDSAAWKARLIEPTNTSRLSFLDGYLEWLDDGLVGG